MGECINRAASTIAVHSLSSRQKSQSLRCFGHMPTPHISSSGVTADALSTLLSRFPKTAVSCDVLCSILPFLISICIAHARTTQALSPSLLGVKRPLSCPIMGTAATDDELPAAVKRCRGEMWRRPSLTEAEGEEDVLVPVGVHSTAPMDFGSWGILPQSSDELNNFACNGCGSDARMGDEAYGMSVLNSLPGNVKNCLIDAARLYLNQTAVGGGDA